MKISMTEQQKWKSFYDRHYYKKFNIFHHTNSFSHGLLASAFASFMILSFRPERHAGHNVHVLMRTRPTEPPQRSRGFCDKRAKVKLIVRFRRRTFAPSHNNSENEREIELDCAYFLACLSGGKPCFPPYSKNKLYDWTRPPILW